MISIEIPEDILRIGARLHHPDVCECDLWPDGDGDPDCVIRPRLEPLDSWIVRLIEGLKAERESRKQAEAVSNEIAIWVFEVSPTHLAWMIDTFREEHKEFEKAERAKGMAFRDIPEFKDYAANKLLGLHAEILAKRLSKPVQEPAGRERGK